MQNVKSPNTHIIYFENGQSNLTEEVLDKQIPASIQRISWPRNLHLKFIAYKQGVLHLQLTGGSSTQQLTLQVKNNAVHLNCSCNSTEICEHIYGTLLKIVNSLGSDYFQKLQPDHLFDLAFKYNNWFDKKECNAGMDITVRSEIKPLYGISCDEYDIRLDALLNKYPVPAQKALPSGKAMVYLITIARSYRLKLFPAVIPSLSELNKDGRTVKSLGTFLNGLQPVYADCYTAQQQNLNAHCLNLWKMVEALPLEDIENDTDHPQQTEQYHDLFLLWQQMMPLLLNEQQVYGYWFYGKRELKHKPRKSSLFPVNISCIQPKLIFVLTEHEVFYRLELAVEVNKELVMNPYTTPAGCLLINSTDMYILTSFKDVCIALWMHKQHHSVTIFKEHFPAFEQDWLAALKTHYPVLIKPLSKRSKKQA